MSKFMIVFTERMNNSAQSIDVVKDCFGMTEVRKNKSLKGQPLEVSKSVESFDEEYHWYFMKLLLGSL